MIRTSRAACSISLPALGLASLALAQTSGMSIRSKHYSITNIDPAHFRGHVSEGTFSVRGMPRVHAELPDKHVTLDAQGIDGKINSKTFQLQEAKLTGGVKGSLDTVAADGTDHFTFSGATVLYSGGAAPLDPGIDLKVYGGAAFSSSNATAKRKMSLTGSQGTFTLRRVDGELGLATAELDGPVMMAVTMAAAQAGGNIESGNATAGHLSIHRGGQDGTDYLIRLTGGVEVHGKLTGQFEGATIKAPIVDISVNSKGVVQEVWTEADTVTTVSAAKAHP